MEIDLERHEGGGGPFRAQVCVVGAGIAGITLAHALSRRGVAVALLEAGGRSLEERGQSLLAEAIFAGEPHAGTREGRFRVYGGSSLRWGGQLLRMPVELEQPWPVDSRKLASYAAEAERLLGVDQMPYGAEEFFAAVGQPVPELLTRLSDLEVSLSKWTPFLRRNLAQTLGRALLSHARVQVYLHAQATELLPSENGARIVAVQVRTQAGRSFRFEADHIVVAAGTVETARLLLASRSRAVAGVGNATGQVGKNFHDHPTVTVAEVCGGARTRLLQDARPWVYGETLHSVKMEASAALRKRLGLNPVLAHMTLEEPEGSGVEAVRSLMTATQHGALARTLTASAGKLPGALLEAVRLGWAAKVKHRRFVSAGARVRLQLNLAQDAPSSSSVTLSDAVDGLGMPQPVVAWRVTEQERKTLRRFADYLKEQFAQAGLQGMEWVPEVLAPDGLLPGMDDARHAMGGACMGVNPQTSVVDGELRVHGVGNLWVASAAVFPTGSPQLPTLPLMALTLRLAEQLADLCG